MRLDKYLADCGAGTRSEVKKLIRSGAVQVSGTDHPTPETQINPETAKILLCGAPVKYRKFIYLMLNKPRGYISATWDARLPTVLDLVPEEFLHFKPFPVGRLDIDTEGLCLMTNDGQLAHRLLSPSRHVPKTYMAVIDGAVTPEDAAEFKTGVVLDDGYKTKSAFLEILSSGEVSEILLTITEGKFHQVKRMFEAVGKKVTYLKRISINRLTLDKDMQTGAIRELSAKELALLECDNVRDFSAGDLTLPENETGETE